MINVKDIMMTVKVTELAALFRVTNCTVFPEVKRWRASLTETVSFHTKTLLLRARQEKGTTQKINSSMYVNTLSTKWRYSADA